MVNDKFYKTLEAYNKLINEWNQINEGEEDAAIECKDTECTCGKKDCPECNGTVIKDDVNVDDATAKINSDEAATVEELKAYLSSIENVKDAKEKIERANEKIAANQITDSTPEE